MSEGEWENGAGGEEDLSLPKATVFKLINEMIPANMTCSKETREMLLECCTEFVHLLTTSANDVSEKDQKKTITGEHVVTALEQLGFAEYIPEVQEVFADHQKTVKETQTKASAKKLNKSGMSQEELLRQQQLLFEQARVAFESGQPSGSGDAGSD